MSVYNHEHYLDEAYREELKINRNKFDGKEFEGMCVFSFPVKFIGIFENLNKINSFHRLDVFDEYCRELGDFLLFNIFPNNYRNIFQIISADENILKENFEYYLICNVHNDVLNLEENLFLTPGQGVIFSDKNTANKNINLNSDKNEVLIVESLLQ